MSVLFVIDTLQKGGGAQKVLLSLARVLQKRGLRVTIFVIKKCHNDLQVNDLDIVYCIDEETQMTCAFYPILDKLHTVSKPFDLLFGFMDFGANFLTALSASLGKKPYVLSVRSEVGFSAGLFDFPEITNALVSLTYANAGLVVCNSRAGAEEMIAAYGIDSEKIFLLSNPMDVMAARTMASLPLSPEEDKLFSKKTLVAIGRLVPSKNYLILCEAVREMIVNHRCSINLIILGEGPERNRIEAFVTGHDLQESIHLPGNQENVFRYLSKADVFVHPSLSEGFPNVVLEAMASGIPIAASEIDSVSEVLIHAQNALLFDPNDVSDIAATLFELISDPQLSTSLATQAYETVQGFSYQGFELAIDTMLSRIEESFDVK